MKLEAFKRKLKERGAAIKDTNDPNYDEGMLNDSRALKGLIQFIDFDCQLNDTGGCKDTPGATRCCCNNCVWNGGFFRMVLDKDLKYYARRFSVNTGFWRKGKGCNLPHRMRSITCLTHHCNHERKDDFSKGMVQIKYQLQQMRERI